MKISNTILAVFQLMNQLPAKPAHNFMTNLDLSFTSVVSQDSSMVGQLWKSKHWLAVYGRWTMDSYLKKENSGLQIIHSERTRIETTCDFKSMHSWLMSWQPHHYRLQIRSFEGFIYYLPPIRGHSDFNLCIPDTS